MKEQSFHNEKVCAYKNARIISQLQRDIMPLQGLKKLSTDSSVNLGVHPIENSFPYSSFPIGCIHEFLSASNNDIASTNGFVAALLSKLMLSKATAIWISTTRNLFPAALKNFGIDPEHIIFIDLEKEKDVLYTIEEALKCNRIATVIAEIKQINFKESRRLQLAAEQSRVTGFIIRHQPKVLNTIACVSRWCVKSLPSELSNGMPGVGFPRWNVELLKVRNGKPGSWKIEYSSNSFQEIKEKVIDIPQTQIRNVG
ncbi:MAG TPA: Error-prone repair protein ImuA [Parafilimonas sp.]|nr:Error-prone repair protein ImuA [Parafilimonas sp.]